MVSRVTTLQPFRQDACHGQRPSTARPWLAAVCTGLVLAAILTTIALVLDDTPSWLLLIGLTLSTTLALGSRGQAQGRRRQD